MDRVLLRTTWIILNNRNAELNQQTYMTGINNFACLTKFCNVCRICIIIHNNALDYYIGTNMASDGTVHATRYATHFRLQPIKRSRTSEKFCFQLKRI